MPSPKYLIVFLVLPVIFYSCRSTRPTVRPAGGEPNAAAYVERYKDLAVSEMKRTGIPASITLAQGMIESDFGRSRLAREANNHFGIKCHDDWTGPTIKHRDDRRNECFRKYDRPEDSFYDHSDFLTSGSRYTSLFEIPSDDYKGWARGLKKAGYATNPDYASMLIRKIEENNLHYFDVGYSTVKQPEKPSESVVSNDIVSRSDSLASKPKETADNRVVTASPKRIMENNRIQYIIVMEGETREIIEKQFQLLKWELPRYNELEEDFVPVTGQLLYLQPKREKAEPGKETHLVAFGDTMYSVSQKYGVKVQKLYEYNRMTKGEEPAPGDKLWLRSFKPVI